MSARISEFRSISDQSSGCMLRIGLIISDTTLCGNLQRVVEYSSLALTDLTYKPRRPATLYMGWYVVAQAFISGFTSFKFARPPSMARLCPVM